ncbi:MAG: hypothetical protein P1U34_06660 [Coxiellaceae bacterium]|nr:hypothetical protein [Coxiellaceae bacterium]
MRHILPNQQQTKQAALWGLFISLCVSGAAYALIDTIRNISYGFADEYTWRHQPPIGGTTIAGVVAVGALCGLFTCTSNLQRHHQQANNGAAALHLGNDAIEAILTDHERAAPSAAG